jgi:nicotinamide-nucleotide amidase
MQTNIADELADAITAAAVRVLELSRARGLKIATAESCTGGLIIATLTDLAGASDVVERGFVTYSNAAKQTLLGVPAATLNEFGAVSAQAATAMVQGALTRAPVDLAVAVTGIAGPGGGTPAKPVGLVHLAAASREGSLLTHEHRFGSLARAEIRRRSVLDALVLLQQLACASSP